MSGPDRIAVLMLVAALSLLGAASAAAEFGPIELISKSAGEQADEASEPAISADGRFVALKARLGGTIGIFRKEPATGALSLVVEGATASSISAPSISADGRFVAFTTTVRLDPDNDRAAASSDVYVADMAVDPPAYELASARDKCDPGLESAEPCGLAYAANSGAIAGAGIALSADGRRLAFLVKPKSDLTAAGALDTPGGQVAVRDLGTDETILISVRRDSASGTTTEEPVPGGATYLGGGVAPGASLSADGSTVAWLAEHLSEQVPMLSDEPRGTAARPYDEPLWRRVPSGGSRPPTRRVVGGGDPLAPGCPPDGTLADPACQGPLDLTRRVQEVPAIGWVGAGNIAPRLSADGNTVALVGDPDDVPDLYVVDMRPGLSRKEAMRRLTRWTNPAPELPLPVLFERSLEFAPSIGPIAPTFALSADGRRIAFATERRFFPLVPPTLISAQLPSFGPTELYEIDLAAETIERATPGPAADVSLGGGASEPAYAGDRRLLAFASNAHNLVASDANGSRDVFLVGSTPAAPAGSTRIESAPPRLVVRPRWRLKVRAFSRPDGRVRVVAVVPGAGVLRGAARAQLGAKLRARRVAGARRRARSDRVVRLDLRLPKRLRRLARRRGGLDAAVRVVFRARNRKPLRDELDARFRIRRADRESAKKSGSPR